MKELTLEPVLSDEAVKKLEGKFLDESYIKHLLEHLNIDLSFCIFYEKMYWDIFLSHICCFDGIMEFIKWIKIFPKYINIF